MNNIKGLSKGVSLVSVEFNTAVKYVTRKGFVNDFPITFEYTFKEYLRTFVGFKQRDDFSIVKLDGVDCIRFAEDLDVGVSVTIRRITPSGAVPHVYQYTGNAQGGAEFSAKTMDENFEYLSGIVEEVEEYNSITMDSLSGLEDSFKDVQLIAEASKIASEDALEFAEESLEVALGIDGKAQAALDISEEAKSESIEAMSIAQGINSKAQLALDNASKAEMDSTYALGVALGVDSKAQEALDNSNQAVAYSSKALDMALGIDGKAQEALDSSQQALKDIDNKRDLDDNVFHGLMSIMSDKDDQGAGIFLQDTGGMVRGQVVTTDQGLQLTQYPKDGGLQTFTFPNEGGELVVDSNLPYVTPEMFGASGNGESDDTVYIQQALATGVNVVMFGAYKVTSTLVISNSNCILEGGKILADVGENPVILIEEKNVSIRDMYIDGMLKSAIGIKSISNNTTVLNSRINNLITEGIRCIGIELNNKGGSKICSNVISNCSSSAPNRGIIRGIMVHNTEGAEHRTEIIYNKISNITGYEGDAIHIMYQDSGNTPFLDGKTFISGNNVEGYSRRGIKIQANKCDLIDNYVYGNFIKGEDFPNIDSGINVINGSSNNISRNTVKVNSGVCIKIQGVIDSGCYNIALVDNLLENSGEEHSLYIDKANNSKIQSNTFYGHVALGNTHKTVIMNNTFSLSHANYVIFLTGTCVNLSITNNVSTSSGVSEFIRNQSQYSVINFNSNLGDGSCVSIYGSVKTLSSIEGNVSTDPATTTIVGDFGSNYLGNNCNLKGNSGSGRITHFYKQPDDVSCGDIYYTRGDLVLNTHPHSVIGWACVSEGYGGVAEFKELTY